VRALPIVILATLAGCGPTIVLDRSEDGRAILIRSPQPDADDLRELHADAGIRTVLNLRGEKPEKGWFQEEAEGVRAIGARWVHVPLSGSQPPPPEHVETFFSLVEDPANWPILMHCMGGVHRAGAFSALFRIQYMGWDNARAVQEMEDNYFNWTTRDREPLKQWLLQYERDPERRALHPETVPE